MEPTSAEAFLLIGRINQRLGDQKAAISALKTAIFWESKTIDAHTRTQLQFTYTSEEAARH